MFHTRTLSRQTRTALQAGSLALRWMLLVIAWQGPLPWCHSHGTLGNCANCPSADLQAHLQSHHPAIDQFADLVFSWHFHVDMPVSPDEPDEPSDYDAPRVPATDSVDVVASSLIRDAQTAAPVTLVVEFAQQEFAAARRIQAHAAQHFFDSFAPTLSVPERFCVARC
ncbi:hypothetical protein NA78x_005145 [Anatilimnocola sp. NA78]|uniref:hypothetical protein n=1 Tax=Anatilimnocola sp. NA78 TaxID=3415683 RepID=UPI003CE4B41D